MKGLVFIENIKVKEGVSCEVYSYENDDSKDLGIVTIEAGYSTPKQEILNGDKTLEIYKSGKGKLVVNRVSGDIETYSYPGDIVEVEVNVGDVMQWFAETELVFHEICYPPYSEGRFKNL